ncbi:MAG: hypothetical protein Q9226_004219 [Calogaya cf. arnoldii]
MEQVSLNNKVGILPQKMVTALHRSESLLYVVQTTWVLLPRFKGSKNQSQNQSRKRQAHTKIHAPSTPSSSPPRPPYYAFGE